jgi:hypothetical protein
VSGGCSEFYWLLLLAVSLLGLGQVFFSLFWRWKSRIYQLSFVGLWAQMCEVLVLDFSVIFLKRVGFA